MKKNFPVTNKEVSVANDDSIISTTDTKGQITYVNDTFITISGFTEQELLGQSHNIVRHPDMPVAVFEDLWKTIKSGKTWAGIVKNRCKNGDHYWVEAFVMPIYQNKQLIGYQSVRNKTSQEKISQATALYNKLNNKELLQLPTHTSILNSSIRLRLFPTLLLAAILPFMGDILWSFDLVSNPVMVSMALLSSVFILTSVLLIHYTVLKPLDHLTTVLKELSNGNLQQSINISSRDEIGSLQLGIKILQARLQTIIGKISEVAQKTSLKAENLYQSSQETVNRIDEQHQQSQLLVSSVNTISDVTQEVVFSTEQAVATVQDTVSESDKGKEVMADVRNCIVNLDNEINKSAKVISELNVKSQNISTIIGTISGIAEQTNLLALNAAIEAARAGEAGRGFAVVADEVRTLASRTQEATVEINELVEALQSGVGDAVSRIELGMKEAATAVEEVNTSESALNAINLSINNIADKNQQISEAAVQQFMKLQEINQNVGKIGHLSENILEIARANNIDADEMIAMSDNLTQQFKVFQSK